jgi:hypothetical protein
MQVLRLMQLNVKEQSDSFLLRVDLCAKLQFLNTVAEGTIRREWFAEHDKVYTHWVQICPKTTIEKFTMMHETFSEPLTKFRPFLNCKHDARAAILQIAIRRANARRHNIAAIFFPQEAHQ